MTQIVKCFASWCGPCKQYQKHWDAYEMQNEDTSIEFISVDLDSRDSSEWKRKLSISSIPYTVVLIDDEVVRSEVGLLKHQQLKDLIYGQETNICSCKRED